MLKKIILDFAKAVCEGEQTMIDEKKVELMKKLQRLAERGVGGEKEGAQKKLQQLMKKYDISFDELLEEGTTVDGELLFDIADPRSEFESEIIHKFYMEDFKAQLPGVDSKILQMRYDGHSLKEIAAAVGFKTPSAVSKHVEKIAERYDNFISDEYGKLLSKCIN